MPRHVPSSPAPALWRLALRQLVRDLRAGELKLLLVAVSLAVSALTAVAFFADRMQAGLSRDAAALLGGDALIAGDQPLPTRFAETARAMGLKTAQTATFPSMARAEDARGGATRLVALKAVSNSYPLRGQLELKGLRASESPPGTAPRPGHVWADAAVLDSLGLNPGDTLLLGELRLMVDAIITNEPDRGAGFLGFAPRVMMALEDLPATGLVQPASRITWRLAVAGHQGRTDTGLKAFIAWAQAEIDRGALRGVRIESLDTGRPEMRQTLDRADQFLRLVAVLSALLAALAVGIAARGFALRHLDACAMLRVLGLSQARIAALYISEFLLVGLAASAIGVLLGLVVHQGFVWLLAGLVEGQLPAPGWSPVALGLGVGMSLLLAFGLPPVLQLSRVPPLRVLRRDLGQPAATSVGVLVAGVAGFSALMFAAAADIKLGSIAVGGFALAWAVFAAAAWAAVKLLQRSVPEVGAPRWLLLATRQLTARPGLAMLQVSALALGLTALGLLVLLRTDLVDSWRQATPPDAPNRFVINVQPDQAAPFRDHLSQAGLSRYDWYPMIRGRLVAINGRVVKLDDYEDGRARRLVDREFNLSHSAALPERNEITAGRWVAEEPDGISVEKGLAETLNLHLGDRLRFDVAGNEIEARITSLRKVDWASMRVNFFALFPRSAMPELPASYIGAYHLPASANGLDKALVRDFPNITLVDVGAQVAQVQSVLNQVIRAVEFLFGFTVAAGLVVLFATMGITREARAGELALMRALGASAALLQRVQRAELLGLGALAGGLAALAAMGIGWGLARYAFDFAWRPSPWVPLIGLLVGALLAWTTGWWSLRGVLQQPVAQTLRRTAET